MSQNQTKSPASQTTVFDTMGAQHVAVPDSKAGPVALLCSEISVSRGVSSMSFETDVVGLRSRLDR